MFFLTLSFLIIFAPLKYQCFISFCSFRQFIWINTRIHPDKLPETFISCISKRGTLSQFNSRAACAGKAAFKSGVTLNKVLTISSIIKSFSFFKVTNNSLVFFIISSLLLLSTVIAPLIPRTNILSPLFYLISHYPPLLVEREYKIKKGHRNLKNL